MLPFRRAFSQTNGNSRPLPILSFLGFLFMMRRVSWTTAFPTLAFQTFALCAALAPWVCANDADQRKAEEHFERNVRPVLIERCHKCHAGDEVKGGLRLDSRAAALRGGESGPTMIEGKPDESLLVKAIRHQDGLEMPPDGKLSEGQIAAIETWIASGAVWPGSAAVTLPVPAAGPGIRPIAPNEGELIHSLQLWLKADSLRVDDGEIVSLWPDQSGRGRDMAATKGIRDDGAGLPGKFVKQSAIRKRPAVRFDATTGYATSPDLPVDIRGDAALTIMLVVNLQPDEVEPPYDGIFGLGNPAFAGDPGKPLAAVIQLNRDGNQDNALHFAGGWNHDASLGSGSFKPYFGKSVLVTVTKTPGPIAATTNFYINGEPTLRAGNQPLEGRDTVPDIQHRRDIGAYLGKAVGWCGSIQGDVGEVVVYNRALAEEERQSVEAHLADKYGLLAPTLQMLAPRPKFTSDEQSWWAYQPVRDAAPPAVKNTEWIASPVDQFILATLEARSLSPAPATDKRALLRRVTFDLTGLPPTPEETRQFLADASPDAYERVVERLLASPHYGERWGRHWLDVVRYAETTANDANAVMQYAWRYRNYVIEALNRDLPYDQFVIEQLAGDLLPSTGSVEEDARRIIATGFLMVGPKALAETDKEQSRLDIVDDQIDVTSRTMLGLTVACARCHDHKFDAIKATDYYAMAGVFRSTEPFQNEVRNATMWWEFPIPLSAGAAPAMVMAPKEGLPKSLRVHLRGNRFTLGATARRGAIEVADRSGIAIDEEHSGRLELARWIADPRNPLTSRVMVNRIWQHHFGRGLVATSDNFGTRGERPTHPELLDWLATRFIESGQSVKAMHRLIVLSNTYRQQSVAESARQGDADGRWLSSFPRRRLSAEEIRDAMLAVSGGIDANFGTSESGEYLLSKAEDIKQQIMPNRLTADDPIYTTFAKRSVYLPIVRNVLPDVLALFDGADPNNVTAVRNETTVASQSLFMINSAFVRGQAKILAERVLSDRTLNDAQRIELVHQFVFQAAASESDLQRAQDYLARYVAAANQLARDPNTVRLAAWQSYCQVLLCENAFVYLD